MKKIIISLCFLLSIIILNAETLRFKATGFSYRERNYYSWSNWRSESSNVKIVLSNDILTIYSPTIQVYTLYNVQDPYQDSDGDYILKSSFIDQDGDKGEFDLIYRWKDEMWQIYIRFNNIQWVYDIVQIN